MPIRVVVEPGPLFKVRTVTVRDARTGRPFDPQELPPRLLARDEGSDAASATVLAAEARIVDRFRNGGHPFVKVVRRDPVVDHRSNTLDVSFAVDPGPKANLGDIVVRGTENVDPAVVRSFIYAAPGDPYSPKALTDIRKSVSRIEALGSVRVREAEALDASGRLPVAVDVTERPPRLVGFSARYSTLDGPGLRAYWANRNLFGGAERLRFDADLYYATRDDIFRFDPVTGKKRDDWDWSDIGGRFSASFLKPALYGTRWDLLVDGTVAREVTDYYTARFVNGTGVLRYRFSDTFSMQGGIEAERGQSSDTISNVDYTLVGLPLSVTYNSTDNLLDPTRGVRLTASLAPYPKFLGSDPGVFVAKAQGSTYYAFDEDARTVIAGRVALGSISGADLDEIPSNRRFYAGGGGSVRGYKYQSLVAAGPLRRADRRPQPLRSFARGPHQGDGHDRHRALRRCRHGVRIEPARFRRARPLRGGSRPALLHGDRADPPRRRGAPRAPEGRPAGRDLHQPRAGLLMRRLSALALAALGLAALALAFFGLDLPVRAQSETTVLGDLISRALSTSSTRVSIGAVDGALSSDATIRNVAIADRDGVWLRLDRARLIWRRAALFSRRLEVDRLEIGKLEVLRRPVSGEEAAPASNEPLLPELPVKIEVKAFSLAELALGEPVVGAAARLSASGSTKLGPPSEGLDLTLEARRLDAAGRFSAKLAFVPQGERLDLRFEFDEPAGGLVARFARLPGCRRCGSTSPVRASSTIGARPLPSRRGRMSAPTAARASCARDRTGASPSTSLRASKASCPPSSGRSSPAPRSSAATSPCAMPARSSCRGSSSPPRQRRSP